MKKKIILSFIFMTSIFILTGCTNKKLNEDTNQSDNNESETNNMETIMSISININDKNYNATLEDNETAQSFAKLLPQSFNMNELNGNEKYFYMESSLPTNASNPNKIEAGDIMLYGNNCLVVFYKSFHTSYSYTKIGHIDNLPDLGNGNITISFKNENT